MYSPETIGVQDLEFLWYPMLTHPRYLGEAALIWAGSQMCQDVSKDTKTLYKSVDPEQLANPIVFSPMPRMYISAGDAHSLRARRAETRVASAK